MSTLNQLIKEAKDAGLNYAVFKNWHQPTPTRKEIEPMYGPNDIWYNRLQLQDRPVPASVKYFMNEANQAYPDKENDFYILSNIYYRNFYSDRPGSKLHKDTFDVIHLQCTGVTKWEIGTEAESTNDPANSNPTVGAAWDWKAEFTGDYETFILEPGDVIWFNNKSWHRTENICDKYSIVMQTGTVHNRGKNKI